VAFTSDATNLVANDLNSTTDVFVHSVGGSGAHRVTAVPGEEVTGLDFGNVAEFALDLGDAPASYGTLLADDGARHVPGGPFLGLSVDPEADGRPSLDALGDDGLGLDDEDGVAFVTALARGFTATAAVSVSMSAFLDAWVDFDGNGMFDPLSEQVFASVAL